MTVYSQNGFSANDRTVIASYTIPGTTEKIAVRKKQAGVVLLDLLGFINAEVIGIQQAELDEWGYAERNIRGSSTTLSNHASGTAVDVDSQKHPLGATGTWTASQVAKIEARLKLYDGVVRWGRDYHGRKDEMHFELASANSDKASAPAIVKVAEKIAQGRLGGGAKSYLVGRAPFTATAQPHHTPVHNPYRRPTDAQLPVRYVEGHAPHPLGQSRWVQWALGFTGRNLDGEFGPATKRAVESWQRAHRLHVDGEVGPVTRAAMDKVTR